jgi:4'-phosphopantetheinyl transferase
MALLPPDLPEPTTLEKQFAEGHLHEGRRLGFLARRRIARAILGALTNMDPSVVEITAGGKGEPVISHPKGLFHLSFSAREDIALIGIATRPIGVDIEIARQDMLIPRNMLREDERVLLDALPEEARPSAFCALWTAKEAIVKAMHCGFRLPPEAIHVEGWNAGPTLTLVDIGTGPGGTGLSPAVWHLKTWPNLVVAGLTGGLVVGAACIA